MGTRGLPATPGLHDRQMAATCVEHGGAADVHSSEQASNRHLLALVSHDLNNSLGVVLNYAALLRRLPNHGSADSALDQISIAAQYACRLNSGLIEYLWRDASDTACTGVNDTVRAAVAESGVSSHAGISVRLDLEPATMLTLAAASELAAVLDCLLDNAAEAMPAGGEIVVSTRYRGTEASGAAKRVGPTTAEITVRDGGVGMTAEALESAFDLAFTTKRTGLGTGLPIAQSIVRSSGGVIEIVSAPSEGTTVHFSWPLASEETDARVR